MFEMACRKIARGVKFHCLIIYYNQVQNQIVCKYCYTKYIPGQLPQYSIFGGFDASSLKLEITCVSSDDYPTHSQPHLVKMGAWKYFRQETYLWEFRESVNNAEMDF